MLNKASFKPNIAVLQDCLEQITADYSRVLSDHDATEQPPEEEHCSQTKYAGSVS